MKFILRPPIDQVAPAGEFQTGKAAHAIAVAFERAGVSAAGLSEHPAPSADWLHHDPQGHDTLDPFAALAFIAAATSRLQIFTNVVVLPFRNPFLTAKAAATLQILSDHRLILGVGVGYQQVEFEALGVPYSQRGALTDEALETIRLAWKGGAVVKQGLGFNAIGNEPRPVPSPPPPIWVGGASDKAVERAARWGDGWMPYFSVHSNDPTVKKSSITSPAHFSEKLERLQELRRSYGRSTAFDVAVGSPHRPRGATASDAEQLVQHAQELGERGVELDVDFAAGAIPHSLSRECGLVRPGGRRQIIVNATLGDRMRIFDSETAIAAIELEQMVADYCHTLDCGGGVAGIEFFSEDCVVEVGNISYRGHAAMKKFYSGLAQDIQTDGTAWTSRHGFTNFRVSFPEANRATVNFLFINFSGAGSPPIVNGSTPTIVSDARFECCRRPDGQWRIQSFHGAPIFFGNDPLVNRMVMGT